ncbi:MAG: DUF2336 domain-containing protein [Maricaulaceae bacterium]
MTAAALLTADLNAQAMLALARRKDDVSRDRLLLAMGDLCAEGPAEVTAGDAAETIILHLLERAEAQIRLRLAERLADSAWAPHDVLLFLALDDYEIAQPVLNRSAQLSEDDLVQIARDATPKHRIAVARRPDVTPNISDALTERCEPSILTVLAANGGAKLGSLAWKNMMRTSARHPALQAPLAERRDLPDALVTELYHVAGEAVRRRLVERFDLDPESLDQDLRAAVDTAAGGQDDSEDEAAARLVDKLSASGRLSTSFLVKALRERDLALFQHTISKLSDLPVATVRTAMERQPETGVMLLCRGAGVDRSVFSTVYAGLESIGAVSRPLAGEVMVNFAKVYADFTPEAARDSLKAIQAQA